MSDEEQLLARFIVRTKRERYVEMISRPKKRPNFLRELAHFNALDPRYLISIPPSQQYPEQIASILTQKGAPENVGSHPRMPTSMGGRCRCCTL